MTLQEIIIVILENIKILALFLFFYSLIGVLCCLLYNLCIRKRSLINSFKKCPHFLHLIFRYYYKPVLEFDDFDTIKNLFAKAFIPILELNFFWVTKKHIKLENAIYKSKNGIFEMKELILKKEEIEIVYDLISENSKFNLVKGKNPNNILTINNKKCSCDVDVEQKRIHVKYSGYYIFNNTRLVFHGKLRYGDSFTIEIDTIHFFDFENQYTIKDLINICNILCNVCFGICCCIFFVLLMFHFKWTSSPAFILIQLFFFRSISSFTRRLFDIFKETRCE